MSRPKIKIIAISNVFCRLMSFEKKDDQELGHCHSYDHGTLISKGKILIEELDAGDNIVASKVFQAPTFAFIKKDTVHRLTSLEDDSQAICIHALRDVDENIISPEFLLEEKSFADSWSDSDLISDHLHLYSSIHRGVRIRPITDWGKPNNSTEPTQS